MKNKFSAEVLPFAVLCCILFGQVGVALANEYQALEKYYGLLHRGKQLSREGNDPAALELYEQALGMAKNDNGEVVARGAIMRLYEKMGDYGRALQETEWFLARNLTAPGRTHYEAAKRRLLEKIEAGKKVAILGA